MDALYDAVHAVHKAIHILQGAMYAVHNSVDALRDVDVHELWYSSSPKIEQRTTSPSAELQAGNLPELPPRKGTEQREDDEHEEASRSTEATMVDVDERIEPHPHTATRYKKAFKKALTVFERVIKYYPLVAPFLPSRIASLFTPDYILSLFPFPASSPSSPSPSPSASSVVHGTSLVLTCSFNGSLSSEWSPPSPYLFITPSNWSYSCTTVSTLVNTSQTTEPIVNLADFGISSTPTQADGTFVAVVIAIIAKLNWIAVAVIFVVVVAVIVVASWMSSRARVPVALPNPILQRAPILPPIPVFGTIDLGLEG